MLVVSQKEPKSSTSPKGVKKIIDGSNIDSFGVPPYCGCGAVWYDVLWDTFSLLGTSPKMHHISCCRMNVNDSPLNSIISNVWRSERSNRQSRRPNASQAFFLDCRYADLQNDDVITESSETVGCVESWKRLLSVWIYYYLACGFRDRIRIDIPLDSFHLLS